MRTKGKRACVFLLALVSAVFMIVTACATGPARARAGVYQADIVVIGAGGAGMAAALMAHEAGASVVVLEQLPFAGGNTLLAIGGFSAYGTRYQEQGTDSVELMMLDVMQIGQNDEALVRVMSEKSGSAADWISDLGADLTSVVRAAGASTARLHRPSDGSAIGTSVAMALNNAVGAAGIPVMLNTRGDRILVDTNGVITGVVASREGREITITTSAVVIATGSFGANLEMVYQHNPQLRGFGASLHPGSLGGGLTMAEAIGAEIFDLNFMSTGPTTDPATGMLITMGARTEGAILINRQGYRFVNETAPGMLVSLAIVDQTGGLPFLVFDDHVRQTLAVIESYITAGFVVEAASIRELAQAIGVDPAVMEETIRRYNAFVDAGVDADFARAEPTMVRVDGPRFYAFATAPGIIGNTGGIRINASSEVLRANGTVIPGLFAAGEVTGGVQGRVQSGFSLAKIFSFGRLAGEKAAVFVRNNAGFTPCTIPDQRPVFDARPQVRGSFTNGVFYGAAGSFGGPLNVRVTVTGGNIVSIDILSHHDTPGFFDAARDIVTTSIIRYQNIGGADTVTGASVSRMAIMAAVMDAMN